jgi:tRNA wybutosine-synthesizing protein 3
MDHFEQQKNAQLTKVDKSFKQSWDKPILNLCKAINNNKNYYTTSSCSGRVTLLKAEDKKQAGLLLETWHEQITFRKLKESIEKNKANSLTFKQEPAILHIAARTLEEAQKLHDSAKQSGWKHCGIISFGKRIVIELSNTEKLEFPLTQKGKILVSDEFLKIIVKESNKRLKRTWEKIDRLEKTLKKNEKKKEKSPLNKST